MNFVDFEWPVWPGPHHSRLRERAQSISESSQHALCISLPVTQKTVPWICWLTISSVKKGFSGRAGEECGPFIFMWRFMTCTLFVAAVVLLIFPPFLSPYSPTTISNKPSWWPRLTHCRTERGPLPHKGMNGSRQSTFTGETRKHCWEEKYHVKHLQYQAPNST